MVDLLHSCLSSAEELRALESSLVLLLLLEEFEGVLGALAATLTRLLQRVFGLKVGLLTLFFLLLTQGQVAEFVAGEVRLFNTVLTSVDGGASSYS